MSKSDIYPQSAKRVKIIENTYDAASYTVTLAGGTSTTLAALIGVAIPVNAMVTSVHNTGVVDVYYNPVGAATVANSTISAGSVYPIIGRKKYQDTVQLYATSDVVLSIIIRSVEL